MEKIEIEELREYLKTLPAKISDIDVKKAKRDFFYFVKSYFPHHIGFIDKERSEFRRWIYKNLDTHLKKHKTLELNAYRGAAKTTLISNLFVLWKLTHKEKRFTVIISATDTLGSEIFEVIKEELENNRPFVNDFHIKIKRSLQSEIVLEVEGFLCKVASYGAGAKIRGKRFLSFRPDLIILDDIENDENVQSKAQRDKLHRWYKKAIKRLPARGASYNILIIGTILHHDSVLARLKSEVEFYKNFPLVLDFTTFRLDNPALDKAEIKKEYDEDKESFLQEYQNIPLSKDALTFNHYKTFDAMPRCDFYSIGIDPSMGKKSGDYFAIAVLGYLKEHKQYYLTAAGYKKNPTDMIEKIIATYLRYAKSARTIVAIETVAYQEFFKDVFKKASKEAGVSIPVKEFKNNTPKELRINTLALLVKDESILIDKNATLLLEELDTYPKAPHDDLLDASEMAKRAFEVGGGVDYKAVKEHLSKKALRGLKYAF